MIIDLSQSSSARRHGMRKPSTVAEWIVGAAACKRAIWIQTLLKDRAIRAAREIKDIRGKIAFSRISSVRF